MRFAQDIADRVLFLQAGEIIEDDTPEVMMAIQRVWKAHGLQPHRVKTFKLSRDKHFVEKLRDVVGLYLNPPEHALVLSVDEKSQIQALDRSQPGDRPRNTSAAGPSSYC